MTGRHTRRFDMLTRVRNFGTMHGQLFPTNSTAHDAFAAVAAAVERLEALDVNERSALQASRAARKVAARQLLADTLARAGYTARVLAKTVPELDARIPLPLPTDDLQLLTLGRQFAFNALPFAAPFAAHGITIAEVQAAIAAFEQALHQRGIGRDDRVKARAEIDAAFRRGMDAVETLDVSVANCLAADPVALAVWKHDRRLELPRRSGGQPAEPEPVVASGHPEPAAGDAPARAA